MLDNAKCLPHPSLVRKLRPRCTIVMAGTGVYSPQHHTLQEVLTMAQQIRVIFPRCIECRRGLAMRKVFVCLSVSLSVKRVHCDKTEKRSVQICIPYERSFSLVFCEEEWLVGWRPLYLKL